MILRPDVFAQKIEPNYPEFPYQQDSELRLSIWKIYDLWGVKRENPFAEWLSPGGKVVLKPNWVRDFDDRNPAGAALYTHSSLIKYLIDDSVRSLGGNGTIVIGDAPIQSCNFERLVAQNRIHEILADYRAQYPDIDFRLEDWRLTHFSKVHGQSNLAKVAIETLKDYQLTDLGEDSFFEEVSQLASRMRVTCYPPSAMASHHANGKHEYLVTNHFQGADLLINLPKMKTHVKAGLTGALKNMVGVNGHKEFLPHHIQGSLEDGGDCYPSANAFTRWYDRAYDRHWGNYQNAGYLNRTFRQAHVDMLWRAAKITGHGNVAPGDWPGNDTIWRMTLDLNHLVYFGPAAPKKVITFVDGIIAGQGEGPLHPLEKLAGILMAGENPASIDAALAQLMGYDLRRIPTVTHALGHPKSKFRCHDPNDLIIFWQEGETLKKQSLEQLPNYSFRFPQHWATARKSPSLMESR